MAEEEAALEATKQVFALTQKLVAELRGTPLDAEAAELAELVGFFGVRA